MMIKTMTNEIKEHIGKIDNIEEKTSKNGNKYHTITIDGIAYNNFISQNIEGLSPGDTVLCQYKEKDNFKNVISITCNQEIKDTPVKNTIKELPHLSKDETIRLAQAFNLAFKYCLEKLTAKNSDDFLAETQKLQIKIYNTLKESEKLIRSLQNE